ncbi:hypothetical protein BVW01_22940 [Mycobacterium tuberculosis]|nr:hypothetical protein BVW01_22940 [Mycobacterium tuberculosis]
MRRPSARPGAVSGAVACVNAWSETRRFVLFELPQGWTEANQANLAAGTEAEPNQALGWLPMQDIDAAAEAAAQPSHALGWLPIEEIDAAASDDGEVSSSPQLPPRPFMMPHTPSGG